ncbi:MAG: 3-dehydroquinate synthase [Opitutaceae bacterium]|nr:3-dehydroquinate synthase [Opitutaceae bacterium]
MSAVETLQVQLAERSYPITFGSGLGTQVAEAVSAARSQGRRLVVVTDDNVRAAAGALFAGPLAGLPTYTVPAGEGSKTLGVFAGACEFLARERIDRGGVLVAVGGGVVGDLGGFLAAAYLRGIDFWQIPTTLLAMVDSAVGGKTGVNLEAGKNLVGAFHQPRSVTCDMALLRTLPAREFAAGMAEVIKYGLLADAALFTDLERAPMTSPDDPRLAGIVRRCCAIKATVVQADERETASSGGRALLNLGHTFAHAIEAVAGYGQYLHGEAVGVGLVAAARLSELLGLVPAADVARVRRVVEAHTLPVRLRAPLATDALVEAMKRDKKVKHGRLRFVVLERLGTAVTRDEVDPALAVQIWKEMGAS